MDLTPKTNSDKIPKVLPEGFTQLEYIEYRPKQEQRYMYGMFETYKEALKMAHTINASYKRNICEIIECHVPEDVLFRVVVPESVFNHVDFINKQDCEIVKPPVMFSYNIPKLYRFVEEKYIDSFFETGELKLTTFEKCKKLEDVYRNDTDEGRSILNGYDGKYRIQTEVGVGSDAIMLCTSLCNLYTDSADVSHGQSIEIFDAQGLLLAIAAQIKMCYNLKSILCGPCFYTKKEFYKEIDSEAFREKMNQGVIDWAEMMRINQCISGPNIYFQKPIDKRKETEFRMIWLVEDIKGNEDIFVTIQNPQKYCRKVPAVV